MCIKCHKIITLRVKNDNHCKNDKKIYLCTIIYIFVFIYSLYGKNYKIYYDF